MKFYLNLVLVVMMVVVTTIEAQDDEARCEDLETQGRVIVEACDKQFDSETPVPLLKCYWRDLKKIPIVADYVVDCEETFPDDDKELFCGVEVLMCSLEKLSKVCAHYTKKDENSEDNSASDEESDE